MTGSSLSSSAYLVRLRPNWSSTLELLRSLLSAAAAAAAPRGPPPRRAGQHAHDLLAHPIGVDLQVAQDPRRHAFALAHQPQQDVLGADVVVAQGQGLAQGQFEDLLRPRREGDLALRLVVALAHDAGDLTADLFQGDFERAQHARGHPVGLAQEAEQQVLGADVVVPQDPGLFLG